MPCFKRKLLVVAMLACAMLLPSTSFAASKTCECFCGSEGTGAIDVDAMSQEKCKETCADTKTQFIGCFTDPSQYPAESDKCWTQSECAAWSDERNGEVVTATWGKSFPASCAKTKTTQEEMHYCYANDVPYDLNISIGNTTRVQNLPEYINVIYTWLLPAASLIAVVMMMIGGLQYTLARGKPKYIDKAKTRITNAITGVVILMSIFVILNLIDPRLTVLDALKIPLIKEVTILDASSSCERLEDYGYKIDPVTAGSEVCGSKGIITDNSGLKENALGSWKVGDTCDYQTCTTNGFTCLSNGTCASCAKNPTPTSATCTALQKLNTGTGGEEQIYCSYDNTTNSCMGVESSSGTGAFYCPSMRTFATQASSGDDRGCEYYETLSIVTSSGRESIGSAHGAALLEEICTKDPCGLARAVGASRCAYNEGAEVTTWFWGAYTSVADGYYCHTF